MAKTYLPQQQHAPAPFRPRLFLVFVAVIGLLVGYSLHVFYWTPPPKPADAPARTFAEGRARKHVHVLTNDIGLRSVATPGLQQAHRYIWNFCQELKQQAAGTDVIVQAQFENYTGSFAFDFVGERFINAYHNISNIILHISRRGHEPDPAVLLVAHHDSPVGSPGAGDDASNVGVMMELASNLVADPDALPSSPVMFLFSGAEEPLCQSAAAFMQSSPWVSRVGVFINLESIGPGGSPIVFQHAGAWVIEAFGKGATHPRGAIAAQDVFDAGLVLGDTDYRQLSYLHRGGLPGIDIAYLLSGAAYHTDRDTLDAIRPGVLQETGETLTTAIRSLADALAHAKNQSPKKLQEMLKPTDHKRMFLSVGGRYMLTYSMATANALHSVPLVVVLTAPFTMKLLFPQKALPAGEGFRAMAIASVVAVWTLLSVLVLPAGVGALRAWASGRAMVWFAQQHLALVMYFLLAAAVLLLPWSRMNYSDERGGKLLPYHVLGGALVNSLLAAVLTRFGVGLSMIFALWGASGAMTAFFMAQGLSVATLLSALLACAWPIYTCGETAVVMAIVLMSRMSLTGHVFIGLGDTIVGFLLGLGAVSITGTCLLPVLQALLGRHSRTLAALLGATALITSAVVSMQTGTFSYSKDMPKRLMLGHVHYTAPQDRPHTSDGPVPMKVLNSSWVIASSDSNPSAMLASAMGFDLSQAQTPTGNEWGMIYPVSKLLDMEVFPAKPASGVVLDLPYVRVVNQRSIQHHHQQNQEQDSRQEAMHQATAGGDGMVNEQMTELELDVFTAKPCWGTLKLSGVEMVSWSMTPATWNDAATFMASEKGGSGSALVTRKGAEGIHIDEEDWGDGFVRSVVVKWTSEHQQGPLHWPLKVRFHPTQQHDTSKAKISGNHQGVENDRAHTTCNTGLAVELHVGYVERSAALADMETRMPEWSTLSYEATTYISKWQF